MGRSPVDSGAVIREAFPKSHHAALLVLVQEFVLVQEPLRDEFKEVLQAV